MFYYTHKIISIIPVSNLILYKNTGGNETMRLWSIHPNYLDAKGLVALWREALLAQAVLAGQTRGYANHPQLIRFKAAQNPQHAISNYLKAVHQEAAARGYSFDVTKIRPAESYDKIPVTEGQILYEFTHLLGKLEKRDRELFAELRSIKKPAAHPLFTMVPGIFETWEKVFSHA
jgi:hypothetical protein